MNKKIKKRGQMKLSFGMIFSIFLMILFLIFAFYGIKKFIVLQKDVQISSFAENLQTDIENMWKSPSGSQEETYVLPKKIGAVCFADSESQNLLFRPISEKIPRKTIKYLNTEKITTEEDPYCVSNIDGEVKLIISKDFGENLVTITRQ
jgi:hypothetical protein